MLSWLRSQQVCVTCGLARSINVHQCKAVTCLSRENVFKLSRFALAKRCYFWTIMLTGLVGAVCVVKKIFIYVYLCLILTLSKRQKTVKCSVGEYMKQWYSPVGW